MLKRIVCGLALGAFIGACGGGGGGDLVKEVEGIADATCACADFDCTRKHIAKLNKITIKSAAKLKDLSESDSKKFLAASTKASDCQDKLRAKK